jgi:DNA polymerase-3 subunit epsilon
MRQIILDTETTGLNARLGDRIIEIGCIEMVNRRFTGNNWHRYLNPERKIEEGAKAVHGITEEFLADKPKFAEIATEFLDYVAGAELIIHNAAFDIEFLDAELTRIRMPSLTARNVTVLDTLKMARELHPGKRNSLDALCDRYQISNAHRTLHGALLDAELLAEVYLGMTRGQNSLAIDIEVPSVQLEAAAKAAADEAAMEPPGEIIIIAASAEELAEHDRILAGIDKESKGRCVWLVGEAKAD